ncbi:phage major capsid protein [Paraburkholderia tropica]|uniref:phage major capsid protein n=1 Tax=Paraburkholderia tropica TaxID=92647 RepID=UPI002AAF7444|nr:phage major capsid protein [Paraburkholderia tropica]
MKSNTQIRVPRGIQSVHAQGGGLDIKALIEGATAAVNGLKEKTEAELADLRSAVDEHSVALASHQMHGGAGGANAREEQLPIYAARGLRAAQISAHYKQRAQAAGEDASINMADFLRGVAGMKCSDAVKASLAVGTDSAGGYAVPSIVMPKILDAMVDQSALLTAGAGILPVTDGAKSVTVAGIDTLPTPAWRNELGAVAESEPTFRGVVATPRSLACIVRISRELLADADDVSRAVTQAISQAFALEFDRVGLVGSGAAPQPLGLYGMEAVTKIDQAGAKFAYSDMLAAYQTQLEHKAPAPTAAIMAPRTLVGLAGLVDTTGQPLNAPPLLAGVRQLSTNGVPVNLGDGNTKSLVFVGNFSTVQYALRETLNIGLLREAYAKTGEIGFLCHARVDVIANYPQAITVIEAVAS